MSKKLKHKRTIKKQWKMQPNVLSALITLLLIVLGALLGGQLILRGWVPESKITWVAAVVMFLATWIGAIPVISGTAKGKLAASYLNAVIIMVAVIILKLIFFPESMFSNWFIPLAAVMGATCAGLVATRRKKIRR